MNNAIFLFENNSLIEAFIASLDLTNGQTYQPILNTAEYGQFMQPNNLIIKLSIRF